MTIFETIKQSVTARDAAEAYGIPVNRNGMACCPFHDDSTPSMKIDERYHCFGCGADGDAINFTAQLFGLSQLDAAKKLAADFGISYEASPRSKVPKSPPKAKILNSRQTERQAVQLLTDYLQILKKWEALYAPKDPFTPWHPKFTEAMQNRSGVEQTLDLFMQEPSQTIAAWMKNHESDLKKLEQRRDAIMAEKPTNKERLKEITDSIEDGIKELFQSDKYRKYLSVMSRFHRYSINNTMLIYLQKPDATLVAGYNKWQNQFERHVKKGEHGITIIAPTPYRKKIEQQKLDPDTKAPMLDKDGNAITEEKEIEIPMYRPVKVFDVSQTEGKPLPQLASSLHGSVQNYEVFLEALRRSAPVPMEFEDMNANTDGYFSPAEQRIAIRTGMSEVQTISAAVHEIAHSKLHNPDAPAISSEPIYQEIEIFDQPALFSNGRILDKDVPDGLFRYDLRGSDYDPGEPITVERNVVVNHAASIITAQPLNLPEEGYLPLTEDEGLNFDGGYTSLRQFILDHQKTPGTKEVEAESVSYSVCQYYGIETGENSFGYIAGWSKNKDLPELKASLETINKTAGSLIADIDRHYKEICQEQGIDLNAQQEAPAKPDPSKWRCYIIPDLMTWNGPAIREQAAAAEKLIGRIDYLGSNGVGDSVEYADPVKFEQDLRQKTEYGVPMSVVLYQDKSGNVIPHDFIFDLDPPPARFDQIENPVLVKVPIDRTPIEFYNTYEEAAARFQELRGQDYNQDQIINPQSDLPYARLTFGIQRENPPSAADLLHVRGGQNYLVEDFSRMKALHTSPEVMEVLHQMQNDLGFDRINHYEQEENGQLLPPVDLAFSEWENPYFEPVKDPQAQKEQAFLDSPSDSFAIYQVKKEDPGMIRFMNLDWLQKHEIPVARENYDLIYTAPLTAQGQINSILEQLYRQFNIDHPKDYQGASMSVSDIIAVKQNGVISCHYTDSFGFREITGFLPDNALKNAPEQPPEHRRSIMAQLKEKVKPQPRKTVPNKKKEMEI